MKRDLLLLAPRPLAVHAALEPQVGEHLAHHHQAGVAAGDDLLGLDPEQVGEHRAQLGDALQPAVVAGVDAGLVDRRPRAGASSPSERSSWADAGLPRVRSSFSPRAAQRRRTPRAASARNAAELLGGAVGQGRVCWLCSVTHSMFAEVVAPQPIVPDGSPPVRLVCRLPRRLPVWWFPQCFAMPHPGSAEGTSSTGRASVSKTEGWGFKSLVPCKNARATASTEPAQQTDEGSRRSSVTDSKAVRGPRERSGSEKRTSPGHVLPAGRRRAAQGRLADPASSWSPTSSW